MWAPAPRLLRLSITALPTPGCGSHDGHGPHLGRASVDASPRLPNQASAPPGESIAGLKSTTGWVCGSRSTWANFSQALPNETLVAMLGVEGAVGGRSWWTTAMDIFQVWEHYQQQQRHAARDARVLVPSESCKTARTAPRHPDAPQLPNPATPRARSQKLVPSYGMVCMPPRPEASFRKIHASIDVSSAACVCIGIGPCRSGPLVGSPSRVGVELQICVHISRGDAAGGGKVQWVVKGRVRFQGTPNSTAVIAEVNAQAGAPVPVQSLRGRGKAKEPRSRH